MHDYLFKEIFMLGKRGVTKLMVGYSLGAAAFFILVHGA